MANEFTNRIELSPPPSTVKSDIPSSFLRWFQQIFDRVGTGPFKIQGYNKADLASVVTNPLAPNRWGFTSTEDSFSSIIYVTDDVDGATLAFSDGTNWLRVSDRAVIS